MSYSCSECGCAAKLQDSHATKTGRRRRFHCTSTLCGHRWSEWEGERPQPPAGPKLAITEQIILAARAPRLTEAQVELVLTRRDISARQFAKLLGISRQAVCNVRLGRSYRKAAPKLERWERGEARRSCLMCKAWSGTSCREGWPDPEIEGPEFARWCDHYDAKA